MQSVPHDKKEVYDFKTIYITNNYNSNIAYLSTSKKQQTFVSIIEKLMLCKDFDRPDGFHFDNVTSILYIFEHFSFDCSPTNENGSSLRRNTNRVNSQIKREIENAPNKYDSVKVIEQGYGKQDGNSITYIMGANGDRFRDNYIVNFNKSFTDHDRKIKEYIENCKKEIGVVPKQIMVSFLIEDTTIFGTHYKKDDTMGDPVIFSLTKQFVDIFKNSNVDYVFFGTLNDRHLVICDKSIATIDSDQYIDLLKEEFYIIPAAPLITAAIKLKN